MFWSNTKSTATDKRMQDCLSFVHTLKILELTVYMSHDDFPINEAPEGLSKRSKAVRAALEAQHVVQRQAKRVADVVLSTLALNCPTLAAVVIKTTWHITDAGPLVHAFSKSKQIDLYGRPTIVGMAVEPHMVKHHVPCADILEAEKFVFAWKRAEGSWQWHACCGRA
jgi:hypothetical protein